MQVFGFTDYRAYLKSAFVRKIERNPNLSLRSFAKHLGLSPGGLSRVLKGDKNLSLDRAALVAHKLGLNAEETSFFCLLVRYAQAKSPESRAIAFEQIQASQVGVPAFDLSVDFFRLISDWYHLAIYEMTQIEDMDFSPSVVAKALGIHPQEVEAALQRLQRLELIEPITQKGDRPKRLKNQLLVSSPIPNEAMRKHYRQILEKASDALETQTPEERVSASETLIFDQEQMSEIKHLTDQYLELLSKLSQKSNKKKTETEVYQASVHVFRLSKKVEKKKCRVK